MWFFFFNLKTGFDENWEADKKLWCPHLKSDGWLNKIGPGDSKMMGIMMIAIICLM